MNSCDHLDDILSTVSRPCINGFGAVFYILHHSYVHIDFSVWAMFGESLSREAALPIIYSSK